MIKHSFFGYKITDTFAERSTGYRGDFFRNNKPHFGNRYFCAYCGKLIRKEKITVDHLYPVHAAQNSRRLRKKLKNRGYKNINDIRNLVPACEKCNKKKNSNLGIWIIKGRIGRHKWLWVLRHIIRITVICYFARQFVISGAYIKTLNLIRGLFYGFISS